MLSLRYDSTMAQAKGHLFEVKCPCCDSTLQIDSETQLVVQHREVERKPLIEDLHSAVEQLKGDAARRNDLFEKSFANQKSSDKVREKRFEELLKQAKEDKSENLPRRPFDLD